MKKLIAGSALGALFLWGCVQENPIKNAPDATPDNQPVKGQKVLSEIQVGEGSVKFIASGDYMAVIEKRPMQEPPILDEKLSGLSWSEIHRRLAPEKTVPVEFARFKDVFAGKLSQPPVGSSRPVETNLLARPPVEETSEALAKSSQWLTFQQFKAINCNILGWWGPNGCWENQGAGTTLNYVQTYSYESLFHVYGTQGSYMDVVGEVNSWGVFGPDRCPLDWVCGYGMLSGWDPTKGCRPDKWHRYKVFHPADTRFHLALNTLNNAACFPWPW